MNKPIIEVSDVSKKYKIGTKETYSTLRDSVSSFLKNPFSSMSKNGKKTNEFFALQDINFSLNEGEVLGIIGRNGAGKSTLLKILSRITPPSQGCVTLRGRVSSLLEVGTGFHPELTGRENIYLNGAVLGMKHREIKRRFEDIVEFAEIEKFLDTPVKRYSSGMYMRLAFAVAAHLEPEILIIDEVLAVGDIQFQNKCLNKIQSVTKNGGRTVIFVSHNLAAINRLVDNCILLENGKIKTIGEPKTVIDEYTKSKIDTHGKIFFPNDSKKFAKLTSLKLCNNKNIPTSLFDPDENISMTFEFAIKSNYEGQLDIVLSISTLDGNIIWTWNASQSSYHMTKYKKGKYKYTIIFPKLILNCGKYIVRPAINLDTKAYINHPNYGDGISFEISENSETATLGYKMKIKEGLLMVSPQNISFSTV